MKNLFLYLLIITLIIILQSCEKDISSQIEGKWQLQEVDNLNNKNYNDSIFFNFNLDVFKIQILPQKGIQTTDSWGIYNLQNDSLYITLKNIEDLNALLTHPICGWNTLSKKYKIKQLNRTQLILSCNDTIYNFRKF